MIVARPTAGARVSTSVVPFTAGHAALVSSWALTTDEVMSWCSRAEAPVPPEVIEGWAAQEDVRAYLLVDDAPIAYGELWIDDDEREVELARIIVSPHHRRRGLGRLLSAALADLARNHYSDVFLRVRPGNDAAVACYRAAGFVRLDPDTERAWNEAQPSPYLWMAHRAE
jgi:[ribosomal protein S18]-alanine N-acetyltransferase